MGLGLIRLSARWDQCEADGFAELDRLVEAAEGAGQHLLLTVGMKAMRWPEFYVPARLGAEMPPRGGSVSADSVVGKAVQEQVERTVSRYRGSRALCAWQVENEPFNRSGPSDWWLEPALVGKEVDRVRSIDGRPVVLNVFSHFSGLVDMASRPWRSPFRSAPMRALQLLQPGDVLGVDAYVRIGRLIAGRPVTFRASWDWALRAGLWRVMAALLGRSCWVVEAQAEPWEATRETLAEPRTMTPLVAEEVARSLGRWRYPVILLWGCEYWLWQESRGNLAWLEMVGRLVETP